MRYCTQCGNGIVNPALVSCPWCGQPLARDDAAQAPQSAPMDYPAYPPPSAPLPLADETPAMQPAYPTPSSTPPAGYAAPSAPFGAPTATPYPSSAPPTYPPQSSGYAGYAGPSYPGYPAYAPPPTPAPKKGLGALNIILIIVLVLVVLGSGTAIAVLASSRGSARASTPAAATATAMAAPSGTLLYQNSFAAQSAGWIDDQNCFWSPDGYHVKGYACYAPIGEQTDVDVSVQVKQISGPTIYPYGLSVRATVDQRYDFNIDGDGDWVVWRCDGADSNGFAKCSKLSDYAPNEAIHGGLNVTNTLEVKAKGSRFDFYVNGTNVGGVTDATYASGDVGVDGGANIECVFTNFTVRALS